MRILSGALLSSFVLDPLGPRVNEILQPDGIECRWFISPFNQYPQVILDEDSQLYASNPAFVIVAVAIEDILQGLPDGQQTSGRLEEAHRRIDDFLNLLRRLADRLPSASIFVHSFWVARPQINSLRACKDPSAQASLALRANQALASICLEFENLYAVDPALAMGNTLVDGFDSRFFYLAKMRIGRDAIQAMACHYRRILLAMLGRVKKCLVLDLDQTLWGGILGEDGPEGISLADDGPGKAFQDFQRMLLDYFHSGILLAICSRNDSDLALTTIRSHPQMILRLEHFAAIRINWNDKASNLRSIADELNLGLDSIVFLDDSAFEREQIRSMLPEVAVPDLPDDPSDYPDFAAKLSYFDSISTTREDQRRGAMYVEERQRRELRSHATTLDDFLRGLDISVRVRHAQTAEIDRIVQLIQRTNQFNLSGRRYTAAELHSRLSDNRWHVYTAESRDKIGDSGIVGVAVVGLQLNGAHLDTFVLSLSRSRSRGRTCIFRGSSAGPEKSRH